ncbi:hypothetical protein NLI96_g10467 [Meripilus lineatus]|uniref:F-box domain-containing protein n=1 Tax=Meripilus lineatus TaxID=2056292 RepID=A0AAD5YA32_9APHY|nr:hypothetical protein NLI96_g10467 [Physisporinus lineatus]
MTRNSRMQASKLPIEICERVIDNLALSTHNPTWDDCILALDIKPTLYACLLVCRDWVHRSQYHLFRQVILCTTCHADAFLDAITHHPHGAQLVRFLSISPLPPPSPPSSPKSDSSSLTPSDPPEHTLSVVPALPSCSSAPSASQVTPSPSRSPSIPNDQQSNVDKTLSQSKSGDPTYLSTSGSSDADIPTRERTEIKVDEVPIPPCHYNWIYKVLIRLPPLLINLSVLHLHNLPALHPRFIRLVPCFKTVKTLTLQNLSSQSFSEIIQVVNRLPRLRSFRIHYSRWDLPARFFPSHRLRLEQLICILVSEGSGGRDIGTDVLDWLGSPQDLSGLQALLFMNLNHSDAIKIPDIIYPLETEVLKLLEFIATLAQSHPSLVLSHLPALISLARLSRHRPVREPGFTP